jgi:hypothetical protein
VLTSVQLFRYDRKLTACALGEPSLALVQYDAEFGLLISGGAHEDSYTARFFLEKFLISAFPACIGLTATSIP